jgi:Phage integrase, N-terminal SAM-like domain
MDFGSYLELAKTTVAQFLEKWLEHVEPNVAPRTFERYQDIVRKNLVPLLGQALVSKLRPDQISAACAKALKTGRREGKVGCFPEQLTICTAF